MMMAEPGNEVLIDGFVRMLESDGEWLAMWTSILETGPFFR
jgi:hypothetical protein